MKMKELEQKVKTWTEDHPKTTRFGKALLVGTLKTLAGESGAPAAPVVQQNAVLGAEQVKALENMSTWQLSRIFQGKNATFANDPETYKALSRLSSWQIDAILGDSED